MEIKVLEEGRPYVIALEGRLDANTSSQLNGFAKDLYAKDVTDIVVDMQRCTFVSSAGLRVIISMEKHAVKDGSLVFRNVQPDIMEVFEVTGFDKILTLE